MHNAPSTSAALALTGPGLVRALVLVWACAGMSAALAGPGHERGQQAVVPAPVPREADAARLEAARQEAQQRQDQMRAYEEQRRAAFQQQAQQQSDGFHRNGRLTPDERRDLRRQINEAGHDIYATPPRH